MAQGFETGVEVNVGFFPHAFFLFAPKIDIDGQVHEGRWGQQFFSLAPGKHTLRLCFMYLFMPYRFDRSTDIVVEEGKASRVRYSMAPWSAKGSFQVQ